MKSREIVLVNVEKLGFKESPKKTLKVYDLEGREIGRIRTPNIFLVPVRKDLVKRAYLSAFTARIQPQGRDPRAGKRTSAESLGVGYGLARIPREKGRRRGRFVTFTVGGRSAHAPTTEKRIHEEINATEKIHAILSGIAATAQPSIVKSRGHRLDKVPQIPMIVVDEFAELKRTSEVRRALEKLGLWEDVVRAQEGTRIRAGKGKMRGRRYYTPKSILIVTHKPDNIYKAARNLPGVDITTPENLNILHLAPGMTPGRLTLYTRSAIKALNERFKVRLV